MGNKRAIVEDVRADGKFFQATWHDDAGVFVVSTWDGNVCVGATRIGVDAVPDLVGVLTHGLAAAAARPAQPAMPTSTAHPAWRRQLSATIGALTARLRRHIPTKADAPAAKPEADQQKSA